MTKHRNMHVQCYEMLIETLQDIGVNTQRFNHFIEPSAGTGSCL